MLLAGPLLEQCKLNAVLKSIHAIGRRPETAIALLRLSTELYKRMSIVLVCEVLTLMFGFGLRQSSAVSLSTSRHYFNLLMLVALYDYLCRDSG